MISVRVKYFGAYELDLCVWDKSCDMAHPETELRPRG